MYWQKYLRFLAQFQRPSHLLAISESSRNDLIAHQPSLKHKISLVPLGVDSAFFHAGKASARMQKLARQPFLLYVGGIDTRKNIVELLRTFYALKPDYPQLRLVVAGKEFTFTDQLGDRGWFDELRKNPSYAKDVIATGFVTQEELLFLYAHAECFVFPSLYEGFGLPILEAMAAGCPVVAYNTSSIPEVAGDACILKDPEESLAGAVRTMLSTPKIREDYRKAGRTRAAQFTWDNTAKAILAKLESYE